MVGEIAAIDVEDGLIFDHAAVQAAVETGGCDYNGIRAMTSTRWATARLAFHVDVNVGNPVVRGPD